MYAYVMLEWGKNTAYNGYNSTLRNADDTGILKFKFWHLTYLDQGDPYTYKDRLDLDTLPSSPHSDFYHFYFSCYCF